MGVRTGFDRLGRVIAVIYWGLAAIFLGALLYNTFSDPHSTPLGPRLYTYTVEWDSGVIGEIRAPTEAEANRIAAERWTEVEYRKAGETVKISSPWDRRESWPDLIRQNGIAAFWFAVVYFGFLYLFRGLRWIISGFAEGEGEAQ